MGAIGIGRRIVHLHVYTPNLLDAEASYQCRKDFASSISFGEHQVMAQLIVTRVLISPLINKDFPVRHPLLARGHFASVNLNHQKCGRAAICRVFCALFVS
jgi:hypothetical protein